jgi:glutamate carboxypeptidase
MLALAKHSDLALAFENTARNKQGGDTGTVGRRASSDWEVTVQGKQGTRAACSASVPAVAPSTKRPHTRRFRQQVIEPDLTFNPGLIAGGTGVSVEGSRAQVAGKNNIIAPNASVKGDLRYLNYEQRDRAHAKMRAIVAASLPGTSASIEFTSTIRRWHPQPAIWPC